MFGAPRPIPLPRRPLDASCRLRRWYENELGWPTVPGNPLRLVVGVRYDVLDVPAEAGYAALRRLAPGSPVVVLGDRMRLLVAAGTAEELPGLLEWLEWGSLPLDLTAIGPGDTMEAPRPPALDTPPSRERGERLRQGAGGSRPHGAWAPFCRERGGSVSCGGCGPVPCETGGTPPCGTDAALFREAGGWVQCQRSAPFLREADGSMPREMGGTLSCGTDAALFREAGGWVQCQRGAPFLREAGGSVPGEAGATVSCQTASFFREAGGTVSCETGATLLCETGRSVSGGRGGVPACEGFTASGPERGRQGFAPSAAEADGALSPEPGFSRGRPLPLGRLGSQGAAVWLRPPEPGCEVEASLPTLSALGGGGDAPDLVRLVNTVATHCHRVRLRRACAQPPALRAQGR